MQWNKFSVSLILKELSAKYLVNKQESIYVYVLQ